MTTVDTPAPVDRDWKEYVATPSEMSGLADAIVETDCPSCGRHVGAMVVDGPDPVFVDVVCPQCDHEFTERVA